MSFKLEISTANAAFGDVPGQEGEEVARILEELVTHFREGMYSMNADKPVYDVDGKRVGFWRLQNGD